MIWDFRCKLFKCLEVMSVQQKVQNQVYIYTLVFRDLEQFQTEVFISLSEQSWRS